MARETDADATETCEHGNDCPGFGPEAFGREGRPAGLCGDCYSAFCKLNSGGSTYDGTPIL